MLISLIFSINYSLLPSEPEWATIWLLVSSFGFFIWIIYYALCEFPTARAFFTNANLWQFSSQNEVHVWSVIKPHDCWNGIVCVRWSPRVDAHGARHFWQKSTFWRDASALTNGALATKIFLFKLAFLSFSMCKQAYVSYWKLLSLSDAHTQGTMTFIFTFSSIGALICTIWIAVKQTLLNLPFFLFGLKIGKITLLCQFLTLFTAFCNQPFY